MISTLRGEIRSLDLPQAVIDVGGVGYGLRTSLATYSELEARGQGSQVELLVYTHVREDALDLYGFFTRDEKRLFERLIAVAGIGPKLALGILSGMSPSDLLHALAQGDLAKLVRIPGVGKKTAERMVVELRDRAAQMIGQLDGSTRPPPQPTNDLVEALLSLGYRAGEAEKAAHAVLLEEPGLALAEAVRRALRRLSRV